jgi:uncharacterized protein YyaL (SSP411 family)
MTDEPDKDGFRFSPRPNRAARIDWRPWGGEAFRLAREEEKPVLLSISAVWCHWCHVMDETNFSDGDTIAFINHNFIPVRVDSDQRPDVNSRYNQGGWPTVCFLTDEGEIIAGVTYVPPDQFRRLLIDVLTVYRESRERVRQAIAAVREQRAAEAELRPRQLDMSVAEGLLQVVSDAYDRDNGGFGTEPKFPYAGVLMFLLARLAGDAAADEGEMVRETLEAMSGGGMYDQVDGGFFRYSTSRDWSRPHYEKMLEDNAALMHVFAEAFLLSGSEDYGRVAADIHRYMRETLRDPETGTFGGSQEADEHYYRLGAEKRDGAGAPFVDHVVYSGWNALAASALFRTWHALGDETLRQDASAALEFVWERMWDEDSGLSHYNDGENHLRGMLSDTVRLAAACLDAYEAGCGDHWIDRSTAVARWMLASLQDTEAGGFFDCAFPPGDEGYPSERNKPPVENSAAAALLIRLAQNTGQKGFEDAARKTLELVSGSFEQYGLFGAEFVLAVMRLLEPPVRVTVVGPPPEDGTAELIRAAHGARIPFRSIEVLDPKEHGEDLDSVGYGYDGTPTAYICVGASCQAPVEDPNLLPQRLEAGWNAARGQRPPA